MASTTAPAACFDWAATADAVDPIPLTNVAGVLDWISLVYPDDKNAIAAAEYACGNKGRKFKKILGMGVKLSVPITGPSVYFLFISTDGGNFFTVVAKVPIFGFRLLFFILISLFGQTGNLVGGAHPDDLKLKWIVPVTNPARPTKSEVEGAMVALEPYGVEYEKLLGGVKVEVPTARKLHFLAIKAKGVEDSFFFAVVAQNEEKEGSYTSVFCHKFPVEC